LSLRVTAVDVGGAQFRVIWAPDFTAVFSRPDDRQTKTLRAAGRSGSAGDAEEFDPETEEEFAGMNVRLKEAAR
jgi:hypothetical protein